MQSLNNLEPTPPKKSPTNSITMMITVPKWNNAYVRGIFVLLKGFVGASEVK